MTNFSGSVTAQASSSFTIATAEIVASSPLEGLSGIVVNENGPASELFVVPTDWTFQQFTLPDHLPRGGRVPRLSGFQVFLSVLSNYSSMACLEWRVDVASEGGSTNNNDVYLHGWTGLASGIEIGSPADGPSVWYDVNFTPIDISSIWDGVFRFGIKGRTNPGGGWVAVPSTASTVTINNVPFNVVPDISPAPLIEGKIYAFDNNGTPGLLVREVGSNTVYYAPQQGIDKIWLQEPQPELFASGTDVYYPDGVNLITTAGNPTSLRYRILAQAPDSDLDCLGNEFRTVVATNPPDNALSNVNEYANAFWLSKPNPSRFAIENLYFDMRDFDEPQVIDHIMMDPITPGPFFHVYYSNDPAPGTTAEEWDGLLWTRVDQTYQLRRKESYALPEPITAKYIKVEFTHLQPRSYSPGSVQDTMTYRKHPKWVIDYFLAIYQYQRASLSEYAATLAVTYDALDLAYNYFLDDLRQEDPNAPSSVNSAINLSVTTEFLRREGKADVAGRIDPQSLIQIKTAMTPYTQNPFRQGRYGDILKDYGAPPRNITTNYPTEVIAQPVANTTQVSSYDRESLVVDKQFPVTSFYLTCRHYYRMSQAKFEQDRAYFVGLKEIAFTREHYASTFDHTMYIETAGDSTNVEYNDFESIDGSWLTYSDY